MKNLTFIITLLLIILSSCNKTSKEKVADKYTTNNDTIINNDTLIIIEVVKSIDYNLHEKLPLEETTIKLKHNLKSFIPKGYSVLSVEYGDLNLDKFQDAILVLRKDNEDKTSKMVDEGKPEKRPLLLLSGQKNGSYKIAFKNDNAILCFDCIGVYDSNDPFSKITIKKGSFTIFNDVNGSRHWTQTITFKYNVTKSNWFLYQTNFINYKPNDKNDKKAKKLVPNYTSLKTTADFGEVSFQKFNIYNEEENIACPQTYNESDDINKNLKSFIPKDYSILSIQYGDLNLDKYADAIMVLRKDNEEETSKSDEEKPAKRPLLILLGQKNGSYKLAYKSDNIIESIDSSGSFGDPFTGITIKNGYFYIGHGVAGGHHWEETTVFKYNKTKNNWFLYKIHNTNYILNNSEGDNDNNDAFIADYDNYKTAKDFGEIPFQKFNLYRKKGY